MLMPSLARLANISFSEGVFHSVFKVGQVTPIVKKSGLPSLDPDSYTPITDHKTCGKIIEKFSDAQLRHQIDASLKSLT
jgi:hypothetical protein